MSYVSEYVELEKGQIYYEIYYDTGKKHSGINDSMKDARENSRLWINENTIMDGSELVSIYYYKRDRRCLRGISRIDSIVVPSTEEPYVDPIGLVSSPMFMAEITSVEDSTVDEEELLRKLQKEFDEAPNKIEYLVGILNRISNKKKHLVKKYKEEQAI